MPLLPLSPRHTPSIKRVGRTLEDMSEKDLNRRIEELEQRVATLERLVDNLGEALRPRNKLHHSQRRIDGEYHTKN